MDKLTYEPPIITVVGSLSAITQQEVDGDQTDEDFPANTPRGDLTFS